MWVTKVIRIRLLTGTVYTKKVSKEDLEEVWEHPWVTRERLEAILTWHSDLRTVTVIREKITGCPSKVISLDQGRGWGNTGQVSQPGASLCCAMQDGCSKMTLYGCDWGCTTHWLTTCHILPPLNLMFKQSPTNKWLGDGSISKALNMQAGRPESGASTSVQNVRHGSSSVSPLLGWQKKGDPWGLLTSKCSWIVSSRDSVSKTKVKSSGRRHPHAHMYTCTYN